MTETERSHLLSSTISRSSRFSVGGYSYNGDGGTEEAELKEKDKVPVCCSYRFGVIICCTLSMTISFAAQASMSSAFVCMLDDTSNDEQVDSASGGGNMTALNATFDFINLTLANGTHKNEWIFDWDKTTQGFVLSSFFMGYYVSQLPSSFASARFGPKQVTVFGLVFTSLFQILAVPAAYYGVGWLYADRIITGIITGFLYAPTFALVGQWTPRPETSLLFGIVGIGMELGNVLSFLISLFACEIDIQAGWPFVFYTLGAIGLIVALFFVVFVSDSPFDNRLMSEKELNYMAAHIPKMEEKSKKALTRIPVKEILKSTPVWAIMVSQLAADWLYYFVVTVSPTFLKDVVKLSNTEVNLLSGLPFLGIVPSIYFAGYVCDKLVTKGIISNTNVRKINDGVCKLIPAAVLVGLGFLPAGATIPGFVLNTINAMALGFSYVSWMANPVDLAPAYTGFMAAICELGAVWVAIVVPILVEIITADQSREQWQLAFYITAGLQVVCYIFYLIFASGELQPWAMSSYSHVYDDIDDIDGKDAKKKLFLERGSKNVLESSSSLTDSISRAKSKRENEEDETETENLIKSLTLSLGDFRGTSSYEAEVEKQKERNKELDDVGRNDAVVSDGEGHFDAKTYGIAAENKVQGSGGISNGAFDNTDTRFKRHRDMGVARHMDEGFIANGHLKNVGEKTNSILNYGGDSEGKNAILETSHLLKKPTSPKSHVKYGHGDFNVLSNSPSPTSSSVSSRSQFDNNSESSSRNVKNLATEIAEAVATNAIIKPTGTDSDHNHLKSSTTKDQASNNEQTSCIMEPSTDFSDSVDFGKNKVSEPGQSSSRTPEANGPAHGKQPTISDKRQRRKLPRLVKKLFTFNRSKSSPDISLPSEEHCDLLKTDADTSTTTKNESWNTESYDSQGDLRPKKSKERRSRARRENQSLKNGLNNSNEDKDIEGNLLFAQSREFLMSC